MRLDATMRGRPRPRAIGRPATVLGCLLVAGVVVGCASTAPGPSRVPDVRAVAARTPDPLARDVVLLRSPDFEERSHAAERLVAARENALPHLGRAGEGAVDVPGEQQVSTTLPVLRSIMGDLSTSRLVVHLDAAWPVVRRAAAEELGQRGRWRVVPPLIERMADDDPQVRAAAASSLRRLTNRFFGYDARADGPSRERAARRWREWWTVEGRRRGDGDGGGGPPG